MDWPWGSSHELPFGLHSVQSKSDCQDRKEYYGMSINLIFCPRDSRMGGRRQSLLVGWSSHVIQILNSSMREFKSFIFDPSPAASRPAGEKCCICMSQIPRPADRGSRAVFNNKSMISTATGRAAGRPGTAGTVAHAVKGSPSHRVGGTNSTAGIETGTDPGVFVKCLSVAPVHAAKESVPLKFIVTGGSLARRRDRLPARPLARPLGRPPNRPPAHSPLSRPPP